MLVSHKYKFIFIKTIKTAGTSTEIFFEPYCISSLSENHSRIMTKTDEGIVGTRLIQSRAEKHEFYNHMSPSLIKEKLGDDVFNDYLKIANIRNPFDILVSHYYFLPTLKMYSSNCKISFRNYLLQTNVVEKLAKNYKNLLFIDGEYCIDEVIRYENLVSDLNSLIKKLDLPEPTRVLSNYKESKERKGIPYQNFYDEETKKIIENNFDFYIELFNYQF